MTEPSIRDQLDAIQRLLDERAERHKKRDALAAQELAAQELAAQEHLAEANDVKARLFYSQENIQRLQEANDWMRENRRAEGRLFPWETEELANEAPVKLAIEAPVKLATEAPSVPVGQASTEKMKPSFEAKFKPSAEATKSLSNVVARLSNTLSLSTLPRRCLWDPGGIVWWKG